AAEWACDRWPIAEHAHTIVESYKDGWAWSVPLSATRRQCTVMIDPPGGLGRAALQAIYARETAKTREIRARLHNARQTSAPWACDASLYDAPRPADGRML